MEENKTLMPPKEQALETERDAKAEELVSFQIQEALPIENGRVLDGTGSPTFALCRAEGSPSQNNPTPEEKADSGAM